MRHTLPYLLILVTASLAGAYDGPRVTAREAGLYVGVAGDYMFGKVPFAFSIDQVSRKSDPVVLSKMVERLHANGKRSILDIFLYEDGNEQAKPAAEYMAWLDPLLSRLPLDKVYAITLSEENIYWNGHHEMLAELYGLVKAKYPTLAVYQWYSPGAGAPGFGPWPLLPADGWLIDEYCRPREAFENMVKKYTILDKPLIHIAWAAPDWKEFSGWDKVWDDQLEICRRYGVPISFFCWWPPDSTPPPPGNQSMWSWSAPAGTEHYRVWNHKVLPYVQGLRQKPGETKDPNRSTGRPIPVAGDEQGQYAYHEDFQTSPQFIDDADLTGFMGLRWTGKRLEVKPDRTATLTYRFESPYVLHEIKAAVKCEGSDGSLMLSLSSDANHWLARGNVKGQGSVALPEQRGLRQFYLRLELSGIRQQPAVMPALSDLLVTAKVDPPAPPQVALVPAKDGTLAFADDFRSQLYLWSGKVTNAAEVRWVPGALRMFGKQGFMNEATVDYHFVGEKALRELTVKLACAADKADMGASVELAVSLDGQTFQPATATDADGKKSFRGELVLKPDLGAGGTKDFWVRVKLLNGCGAATKQPSPVVTGLTVEGR